MFMTEVVTGAHQCDRGLLTLGMVLSAFGLIMVYSASFIFAQERTGDGWFFIWRQCLFTFAGIGAMVFGYQQPSERWSKWAYPLMGFVLLLLLLVNIPGIGAKVGGAQRWIRLGWMSFQPGEMAKYATVLWFSVYLSKRTARPVSREGFGLRKLLSYLIPPGLIILPLFVLLLLQPDFGTVVLISTILLAMIYLAGFSLKAVLGIIGMGIASVFFLVFSSPYRKERVMTYLDPWSDPSGSGFQVIQSLVAFFQGGFFGVGLGNSKEKLLFLPEAHNDFIFAVVGEELGFIGVSILVLVFTIFMKRGLTLANRIFDRDDPFKTQQGLFAAGITLIIGVQAFINMAVAMGLLPTKGMNLPFISYGGSALMMQFFALGVLLRLSSGRGDS